jgi:hypothetical protein
MACDSDVAGHGCAQDLAMYRLLVVELELADIHGQVVAMGTRSLCA